MQQFDVMVIGTGVAGQTAASELAAAGKRVAVVDRRQYGGTCSLRGCEPKKTLFAAAQAVERTRGQRGNGVRGSVEIDWPELVAFKRGFTDPVPERIEHWLQDAGVTTLHGAARFVSESRIEVDGTAYAAKAFVIATGAVPLELGIPGSEHVIDAEQFMELENLRSRVVFVGGGFISFEFAHIAATTGADCTILHRSSHVLKEFDPDLASLLTDAYRTAGIEVLTDAPVSEVTQHGNGFRVACQSGETVECDVVVHGAGRVPDLDGLDLEAANVAFGRRGIEVDSSMRSPGNPRVFAAGDAAARGAPLTPVAIAQARIALANIVAPGSATFAPVATASVVFSSPPLSSVGMGEDEARDAGIDVSVKLTDTTAWASSRRVGATVSGAKTIVERGTGRLVGAHLLGHGADEVINVFAAAIAGGLTADEMRSGLWAYPTGGSDIVYLL